MNYILVHMTLGYSPQLCTALRPQKPPRNGLRSSGNFSSWDPSPNTSLVRRMTSAVPLEFLWFCNSCASEAAGALPSFLA
ncbi:unnamed protein product [Orchesella dallaii]|uniref:Uncharacterized protein n=1 Tax=Orchesella dallaii TaxID=48710 RepID=A0ABP1RIF6_9HEXA